MKYIKTYEEKNEEEYNIGDYILLDIEKMENIDKIEGWYQNYPDNIGVLIEPVEEPEDKEYCYTVEFYDGDHSNIRKSEILRKLTQEEIDLYNTKKDALKYNL